MNEISPFQVSLELVDDHPVMRAGRRFSPLLRLGVKVWFYAYQFWQKTLYYKDFQERENILRYFATAAPQLLGREHFAIEGYLARFLLLGRALIDLHTQIVKTLESALQTYHIALNKKKVHTLPGKVDSELDRLSTRIDRLVKQAFLTLVELWRLSNCLMFTFDALYPNPRTTRFAIRTGWVNLYHLQEEISLNKEQYLYEIRKMQSFTERFFSLINMDINLDKAVSLFESSIKVSNYIHQGDRMLVKPAWWAVSNPGKRAVETMVFTLFDTSPDFLSPEESFYAPPPKLPKFPLGPSDEPTPPELCRFDPKLVEIQNKFRNKRERLPTIKVEPKWD